MKQRGGRSSHFLANYFLSSVKKQNTHKYMITSSILRFTSFTENITKSYAGFHNDRDRDVRRYMCIVLCFQNRKSKQRRQIKLPMTKASTWSKQETGPF